MAEYQIGMTRQGADPAHAAAADELLTNARIARELRNYVADHVDSQLTDEGRAIMTDLYLILGRPSADDTIVTGVDPEMARTLQGD